MKMGVFRGKGDRPAAFPRAKKWRGVRPILFSGVEKCFGPPAKSFWREEKSLAGHPKLFWRLRPPLPVRRETRPVAGQWRRGDSGGGMN